MAFAALVFGLYGFVLLLLGRVAKCRLSTVLLTALFLCGWLGLCAFLAVSGRLLADVEAVPPLLLQYVSLPAMAVVVLLSLWSRTGPFLDRIPADWLVSFQAFRIPMGLILSGLAAQDVVHPRLTYRGYNFDIAAGVGALLLGYLMHKRRAAPPTVLVFNLMGLGLLGVMLALSLLSLPTPFQYFRGGPSLRVVFHVPFVWLPGFALPVALLGHLLSLRKWART